MITHPYEQYRNEVKEVLQSKLDEFKIYEYEQINEEGLWQFLLRKKWRRPKEDIHIYELVKDILSLKVSDVISYNQIEQLKGPDWFSESDSDEWKELLKK